MSTRTRWSVSALVVCVGLLHAPVHAVQYARQRTLTNPVHQFGSFGLALATVGSNLAVGDPEDFIGGSRGSVSLFDGTTLALLRYVPAPTGTALFGTAVADYGGNLLVGSPSGAPNPFKVFIVDAISGALLASIREPPPNDLISPSLGFGSAVATAGPRVLIGAPGDNSGAGSASLIDPFGSPGGAFIFNLANPAPETNRGFGWPLAVLGDRLVVGNRFTGGAVYEFDGSTGALLHTILPPLGEYLFPRALAVDASTLFASGRHVYRFAADGTLLRTYTNPSDDFGNALAVSGSLLLVGSPFPFVGGEGVAYLFDVASGALLQTLPNPEPPYAGYGEFGVSVAIVGKYLAITTVGPRNRVHVYAPCGDAVVDPIEECDDGNLVDGDGCDSNCRLTGCGNGVVTAGEQCDDGNTMDGDCCSADCMADPAGSACGVFLPFPGVCDANGHCVAIPTLSQWGVIVLSVLMLTAVLYDRRRGIAVGRR